VLACLDFQSQCIRTHLNQREFQRLLDFDLWYVGKYSKDVDCERHVIYNNRLMTHVKTSPVLFTRRGITKTEQRIAKEELVKAAENLKEAMKEAKNSIAIVKGNAAARDETSPQYEAAEKAASAYRVYTQLGNGPLEESGKKNENQSSDPLKTISDMDLTAFGFGCDNAYRFN
jgi:CRISPR/Cas system CMR-associated protein Cmr5 small subunit